MNFNQSVVSCEWLLQQLPSSQIVIVDCRFRLGDPDWGREQYAQSHIQSAVYLDLDQDLSSRVQAHGGRHPLPDLQALAARLARLGVVQNQTLVVAYDDSRLAFAARLWWLLRFMGHRQAAVLDGGWQAWLEAGGLVDSAIPQPRQGRFVPQPHTDWIVDLDRVKARLELDSVVLVDSRSRDRYLGLSEPIDPVAGSIGGAVNSPWQQVTDLEGFILPQAQQQQLWNDYAEADEIIVYCGSGVTACVNLLSLELAGFTNTKLYPGGWSDWCSYLV